MRYASPFPSYDKQQRAPCVVMFLPCFRGSAVQYSLVCMCARVVSPAWGELCHGQNIKLLFQSMFTVTCVMITV